MTRGHVVVMGRRTFESIGKPLPDRVNVVVSRIPSALEAPGIVPVGSIEEALAVAGQYGSRAFMIGGVEIYRSTIPVARTIEATFVYARVPGDAFFPPLEPVWHLAHREDGRSVQASIEGAPLRFSFVRIERRVACSGCPLCEPAESFPGSDADPWEIGFARVARSVVPVRSIPR